MVTSGFRTAISSEASGNTINCSHFPDLPHIPTAAVIIEGQMILQDRRQFSIDKTQSFIIAHLPLNFRLAFLLLCWSAPRLKPFCIILWNSFIHLINTFLGLFMCQTLHRDLGVQWWVRPCISLFSLVLETG